MIWLTAILILLYVACGIGSAALVAAKDDGGSDDPIFLGTLALLWPLVAAAVVIGACIATIGHLAALLGGRR